MTDEGEKSLMAAINVSRRSGPQLIMAAVSRGAIFCETSSEECDSVARGYFLTCLVVFAVSLSFSRFQMTVFNVIYSGSTFKAFPKSVFAKVL